MINIIESWPLPRLEALYRACKRTGFFKTPRQRIELLSLVERKRRETNFYN